MMLLHRQASSAGSPLFAFCPPARLARRGVYFNSFTGTLPIELGQLTALTTLYEPQWTLCPLALASNIPCAPAHLLVYLCAACQLACALQNVYGQSPQWSYPKRARAADGSHAVVRATATGPPCCACFISLSTPCLAGSPALLCSSPDYSLDRTAYSNSFTGSLPSELGRLTSLRGL